MRIGIALLAAIAFVVLSLIGHAEPALPGPATTTTEPCLVDVCVGP